jgi:predicted CXXCH cytochrome family protein
MIRAPIHLYIYLIFIFIVIPSTAHALELSSKKGCAICHVMWIDDFRTDKKTLIKWQPTNVLMKDTQGVVSSEAICYSCHDGYVNDSRAIVWKYNRHKTFVKPSNNVTVPSELPLSNKDEIYCGTCHSAHGVSSELRGGRSLFTPFSRVKNIDSSLCEMCHGKETNFKRSNGHPLNTTQLKLPAVLFELGGVRSKDENKVICQSCHKVHGAKGSKITIVDNTNSKLCIICHEKQKSLINTKHDIRLSLPDIKNIKQQRVSQSGPCGACHIPHNAANKRLWARQLESGDLATQMCLSCHGEKIGYDTKHIGNISHPVNNELTSDTSISDTLPLYTAGLTRSPKGRVQCFTCHEVHRWSPNASTDKGGKDIEGDGSNSFLRISNNVSSNLCLDCHKDKKQLITSDHNLIVTAPGEKNIHGLMADQSGPCGACHVPHNASGGHLWAKKISANKDIVTQLCVGCHNKEGAAKAKLIGNHYHPVNIPFKTLNSSTGKKISTLLPFYDSGGNRMPEGKDGEIVCITCHEPHTWTPKQTGPVLNYTYKNIEGDTTNSFLRKANFPSSDLCKVCHADKALVDGTVHDLKVSAPKAVNLLGQTVKESGTCGACHLVHNSPNQLKLWARSYGPVAENESIMDALCTSCHAKKNIAANKIPLIATHPAKKLINNIMRVSKDNKNYTLIFDEKGKEVNVGNLSCPSCHNAHQWSPENPTAKDDPERKLTGKFLRTESYNMVCMDCHGLDALLKYEYFHDPDKRTKTIGE